MNVLFNNTVRTKCNMLLLLYSTSKSGKYNTISTHLDLNIGIPPMNVDDLLLDDDDDDDDDGSE